MSNDWHKNHDEYYLKIDGFNCDQIKNIDFSVKSQG